MLGHGIGRQEPVPGPGLLKKNKKYGMAVLSRLNFYARVTGVFSLPRIRLISRWFCSPFSPLLSQWSLTSYPCHEVGRADLCSSGTAGAVGRLQVFRKTVNVLIAGMNVPVSARTGHLPFFGEAGQFFAPDDRLRFFRVAGLFFVPAGYLQIAGVNVRVFAPDEHLRFFRVAGLFFVPAGNLQIAGKNVQVFAPDEHLRFFRVAGLFFVPAGCLQTAGVNVQVFAPDEHLQVFLPVERFFLPTGYLQIYAVNVLAFARTGHLPVSGGAGLFSVPAGRFQAAGVNVPVSARDGHLPFFGAIDRFFVPDGTIPAPVVPWKVYSLGGYPCCAPTGDYGNDVWTRLPFRLLQMNECYSRRTAKNVLVVYTLNSALK